MKLVSQILKHFIQTRGVHLDYSPNWKLSKKIWDRYRKIPIANCKVQVTYVWIDGTGQNILAKTRTMDFTPNCAKEVPQWDFNGSQSDFTKPEASDVILNPVALYSDPITQGTNKLVLCETFSGESRPTKSNHRQQCLETVNKTCQEPLFGFQQQFQFLDANEKLFGWPVMCGEPTPLRKYYCAVGALRAYGREIVECLYRSLLYCGIEISATHPTATPSQWEIHLGPTLGIKAADDLWISRYILRRIAEDFGVGICFRPNRFPNWPSCGCYTNFSTKEMRDDNGLKSIEDAIGKLQKKHEAHLKAYDSVGCLQEFKSGVGDRTACVRISKRNQMRKKGHFQDRRVVGNSDPYKVINALVATCCLNS